ncbi:MAG: hypothetical protein Q9M14_05995, partial [Mariprofundaceae bacterium]|nr:hypothetical protein [Mariprofundaceae bacterium]
NKQAEEESWTISKRRVENLKLAAEAEYDYRLKNDPSYRLNKAADALMAIAKYSESGDQIRKVVSQMYATGKIRKVEQKTTMIRERVEDMLKTVKYDDDWDTVPNPKSISPAKLEIVLDYPEEYETENQFTIYPKKNNPAWVKPPVRLSRPIIRG